MGRCVARQVKTFMPAFSVPARPASAQPSAKAPDRTLQLITDVAAIAPIHKLFRKQPPKEKSEPLAAA